MMINQIVEEFRNDTRHGSCGVGINETVERNLDPTFAIKLDMLFEHTLLLEKLLYIQKKWIYPRLRQLGIEQVSNEWRARLSSLEILEYFLNK